MHRRRIWSLDQSSTRMHDSSVARACCTKEACRVVLIFSIILVAAIAALAGYWVGVRGRSPATQAPPPAETGPVAAATAAAHAAPTNAGERIGAEKARLIRSRDSEAAALRQKLTDRAAELAQLEEFARDRAQLYRDIADAHADIARYRQLVVDIENNAPPPILAGVGEPDDLKLIVGIGPVLERMLHSLGVTTFRQIARWSERDVAEFDAKLPEFPGRIVRDQWVTQARALHESKYGVRL
jgi:predicted flap endonuclease-1-like 5' DNA nuclease